MDIVKTELSVKAKASLQEEIEKELKEDDPEDGVAKASLNEHTKDS